MKKNQVVLFVMISVCSCSNSSSNNTTYESGKNEYELDDSYKDDEQIGNDEQVYVCPMCGGPACSR